MALLSRFIQTIGGLWELLLLYLRTGGRMNRSYWRWRRETAYGNDPQHWPSRSDRVKMILEYGRWVYRMKRLR